ncbi:hypothetical protein Q6279_28650, partial [Klebsiella variicola]
VFTAFAFATLTFTALAFGLFVAFGFAFTTLAFTAFTFGMLVVFVFTFTALTFSDGHFTPQGGVFIVITIIKIVLIKRVVSIGS